MPSTSRSGSSKTAWRLEIEAEPGQLWRSFPGRSDADVANFGDRLTAAGGRVSILGREHRRLVAAGHAPHGRRAVRLPPAPDRDRAPARRSRACVCRSDRRADRCSSALLPILHETGLDAVRRDPGFADARLAPGTAPRSTRSWASTTRTCACWWTSRCSCRRCRRAISSGCAAGGVPAELIDVAATDQWRDPATVGAIVGLLRSGGVPASVHTLYMDMLVRFGRSDATVIADVLPLDRCVPPEVLGSRRRRRPGQRSYPRPRSACSRHAASRARFAASGAGTSGSTTTPPT